MLPIYLFSYIYLFKNNSTCTVFIISLQYSMEYFAWYERKIYYFWPVTPNKLYIEELAGMLTKLLNLSDGYYAYKHAL